jgi:hypothetical protein
MAFFILLIVAYCAAAVGVGIRTGGPVLVGFGDYLLAFSSAILFMPIIVYARNIGRDDRPVRVRIADAIKVCRRRHLTNRAVVELAASVVLVATLMAAFNAFKFMLPRLHAFSWDLQIQSASRWIHGGRLPYEWLMPLVGSDLATRALDALYYAVWPVVLWAVFVWQVGGRSSLRHRYLVTFAGSWIVLGTVLAILFSSAGPVYYSHLYGGPNPYTPLLNHLLDVHHRHPLLAVRIQQALWNAEAAGVAAGGAGVSAMPSLHVAMAELCAIIGRRSERRVVAYALTGFSVITLVASIYLGAHYALDGYVSIIGVHVLWRASGPLVRRYHSPEISPVWLRAVVPTLVRSTPERSPRSVAGAP